VGEPQDGPSFGNGVADRVSDRLAEFVCGLEGGGCGEKAFHLDDKRSSYPTSSSVNVFDTGHWQGRAFGCGEHFWVDSVHEVDEDLGGDFPADVNDERGDHKSSNTIGPGQAGSDSDEAQESPNGREGVEPGVVGVGNEGS
jgi:hypothetical protein